ncbi:hypothetical protein AC579_6738 [Pseudocercospora musae]|uniref:Major facilitator superfamily (MFS) profile domain-containing protein n=1 Tax=Pseudocercospora musae TaxID=113226 RepID=A0A139H920_9PEZI|nr:hypothetical protein AC579_6738 [Pseudocercospora musae]
MLAADQASFNMALKQRPTGKAADAVRTLRIYGELSVISDYCYILFTSMSEEKQVCPSKETSQDQPVQDTIQRRTVVLSLCLFQFLSALDITNIATALPTITRTLGALQALRIMWVFYTCVCAAMVFMASFVKSKNVQR